MIVTTPQPETVARMQQAISEAPVDTALANPTWGEYFQATVARILLAIAERLSAQPQTVVTVLQWIVYLSIAVAATALIWWGVSRWLRRKRPESDVPEISFSKDQRVRDLEAWRARLEERWQAGDIEGTLEALWWCLALRMGAALPSEEGWTARSLIESFTQARAPGDGSSARGLRDFRQLVRQLDRVTYGQGDRSRQSLEGLLERTRGLLTGGAS